MAYRLIIAALISLFWLHVHAASLAAVAPVVPEPVYPGTAEPSPAGEQARPTCVVAGTVYCSEYGSRFTNTLILVLADSSGRYISSISDTNGSFALPVPCGGSFELSLEFRDKAMPLGSVELPESSEGAAFTLEIRHTGSYLELVRDVRNGIEEDDITYRLVPVGD